jgi:hypothetical protein
MIDINCNGQNNLDIFWYLTYDWLGGFSASPAIQLIGKIYSQAIHIYTCGELPLSYQSDH